MKKLISILLILIMLFAAVACDMGGGDGTDTSYTPYTTPGTTTGAETISAPETLPDIAPVVKPNKGGLMLNEAMASNKSVISDDYGEFSDWIELYNDGEAEISLKNYFTPDCPC